MFKWNVLLIYDIHAAVFCGLTLGPTCGKRSFCPHLSSLRMIQSSSTGFNRDIFSPSAFTYTSLQHIPNEGDQGYIYIHICMHHAYVYSYRDVSWDVYTCMCVHIIGKTPEERVKVRNTCTINELLFFVLEYQREVIPLAFLSLIGTLKRSLCTSTVIEYITLHMLFGTYTTTPSFHTLHNITIFVFYTWNVHLMSNTLHMLICLSPSPIPHFDLRLSCLLPLNDPLLRLNNNPHPPCHYSALLCLYRGVIVTEHHPFCMCERRTLFLKHLFGMVCLYVVTSVWDVVCMRVWEGIWVLKFMYVTHESCVCVCVCVNLFDKFMPIPLHMCLKRRFNWTYTYRRVSKHCL